MKTLIFTLSSLFLALPVVQAQDLVPLVPSKKQAPTPLTPLSEPLAPLTPRQTKTKPAKPPDKPRPFARKIAVDKILLKGIPSEPLKAGQSAGLIFKIVDTTGKPFACEISLTTTVGTITPAVENIPGTFTATFSAPEEGTETSAILRAEVKNSTKPVMAEATIALVPPPPTPLPTPPTPTPQEKPSIAQPKRIEEPVVVRRMLRPTHVSFLEMPKIRQGEVAPRFQAQDEDGHSVHAEGIRLISDGGTFGNLREDRGVYRVDFTPSEDQTGEFSVFAEVRGERLLGEGTLYVSPRASSDVLGFAVGGFVGGVYNFKDIAGVQFELNLELHLFQYVRIGVLSGYHWTKGLEIAPISGSDWNADLVFRTLPVLGRLAFQHRFGPVEVTVGGMLGVAFVAGYAPAGTDSPHDPPHFFRVTPQLHMVAFAGGGVPLGPGAVMAEVRVSRLRIDYEHESHPVGDTSSLGWSVHRNIGTASLNLGYKLEF